MRRVWGKITEGAEWEMHALRPQADIRKEKNRKDLRGLNDVVESGCQQSTEIKNMNSQQIAAANCTATYAAWERAAAKLAAAAVKASYKTNPAATVADTAAWWTAKAEYEAASNAAAAATAASIRANNAA